MSPNPPSLTDYPVGPLLKKARERGGVSVDQLIHKVKEAAEKEKLLNNFKNRSAIYRAEKQDSLSNPDDLKLLCNALGLPFERFRRRNHSPILLDAIMKESLRSDSATLYCQPSVANSAQDRRSFEINEVLVSYFLQSNATIVLVKRDFQHILTSLVAATILRLDPSGKETPSEAEIDKEVRHIARVASGEAGETLKIPYDPKRLDEILRRIPVYELQKNEKPSGLTKIAISSPVTFWLLTDGGESSSFVSLGDHNFLRCGAQDTELMKERFGLVRDPNEKSFKKINTHHQRTSVDMILEAKKLNLEFIVND